MLAEVGAPIILSLGVAGYRSVRRTLRETTRARTLSVVNSMSDDGPSHP